MQKLRKPKNVIEHLQFAKKLIQPVKMWIQGSERQEPSQILGQRRPRFCAIGALREVEGGTRFTIARQFLDSAAEHWDYEETEDFNDSTNHRKVMALFNRAIRQAKKQCGGRRAKTA